MKQATIRCRYGVKALVEPVRDLHQVCLYLDEGGSGKAEALMTITQAEKLRDALTRAIEAAREE